MNRRDWLKLAGSALLMPYVPERVYSFGTPTIEIAVEDLLLPNVQGANFSWVVWYLQDGRIKKAIATHEMMCNPTYSPAEEFLKFEEVKTTLRLGDM